MRNQLFPTLIVDDFLSDIDDIIEQSRKVDFYFDDKNQWPGKRSPSLHTINNDLFVHLGNKILNCYNLEKFYWSGFAYYQLVNHRYFKGWVHYDPNAVLTSIIYLNKNYNINSGTSLYRRKNYKEPINTEIKHNLFKKINENENYIISEYEKSCLEENNNLFYEVLNVKNTYNRLLSFESNLFHSANDFDNKEPRLTLIYFFESISVEKNKYPLIER